jgi:hypothetical protein
VLLRTILTVKGCVKKPAGIDPEVVRLLLQHSERAALAGATFNTARDDQQEHPGADPPPLDSSGEPERRAARLVLSELTTAVWHTTTRRPRPGTATDLLWYFDGHLGSRARVPAKRGKRASAGDRIRLPARTQRASASATIRWPGASPTAGATNDPFRPSAWRLLAGS